MKNKMRKALILIPFFLLVLVILVLTFGSKFSYRGIKHAGMYIRVNEQADIYLNGEKVGVGTFESTSLAPGLYAVKIIGSPRQDKDTQKSLSPSWESQIELSYGLVVAITRKFSSKPEESSGYLVRTRSVRDKVVSGSEITVISTPSQAQVILDGDNRGETPVSIRAIPQGNHLLVVEKEGSFGQQVNLKLEEKKIYEVNVDLGKKPVVEQKRKEEEETFVVILPTPTGWLRVRSGAGTSHPEVARVSPGETFSYLAEESGWYKIRVPEGVEGWVSSKYCRKENKSRTSETAI